MKMVEQRVYLMGLLCLIFRNAELFEIFIVYFIKQLIEERRKLEKDNWGWVCVCVLYTNESIKYFRFQIKKNT